MAAADHPAGEDQEDENMKLPTCRFCGQIVPPKDHVLQNKHVKRRIYEYIRQHPEGVTRKQVLDAVYADCPNGGPLEMNVISVHVQKINEILSDHGIRIASSRGPYATYRLVRL